MSGSRTQKFVVCIRNDEYPASLETKKLYEAVPDTDARKHGQVRVIDESGEDYLYPEDYFAPIKLPKATKEALIT
jgi:hypothetical protein